VSIADDSVTSVARAKLNLALRVGPRRGDGYHPLESLMVELSEPHDTVEVRMADRRRIICPGVAERENLIWSAVDALAAAAGEPLPLEVRVDKRVPMGAGLGGGSSDAAAALRAARELRGLNLSDDDLETIGSQVGSDVPFFIRGGAQWAAGRGEDLTPTEMPRFHALVCFAGPPLGTPSVYSRFDALDPPRPRAVVPVPLDDPGALAAWAHNDLWAPARDLRPDLAALASALEEAGAAASLLCGSGAAMCGLFADEGAARRGGDLMSRRASVWLAAPAPE
jgi:4-diphosphocytidyl-2-C-methyl-D-erythritol kinase